MGSVICIKKSIIWQTILAWFLRSKNAKKSKFSGAPPRTPLGGAHSESFIAPQTSYSWWQGNLSWCTSRSRPFDQASLLRLGVQSITELSVVNRTCKYDYYTTNTQQCIFLLAIVLYFNILILKRSQLTIYIVTPSKAHMGVGAQSTFAWARHFCPLGINKKV